MKICFISGALPDVSCGVGDYVDSLARALTRRDQDVAVLTTASPALRPSFDYRVVPLATAWSLGDARRVATVAADERPDVLHLQFPGVGYGRGFGACFAPWAVRLRGPRVRGMKLRGPRPLLVTTMHEFHRFRLRHRIRLALALSACDLVVAPDPTVLASIRRHLWWRPGLTTAMIPLASNVWPDATTSLGSEPSMGDELVVGYWGFVRPDKGVDLLLEAFAQVRQTRPARLIMAGDPGPDAACIASVGAQAEKLGLSGVIETTGRLPAEALSRVLRSFDVCVLPYPDGLLENRGTYAGAVAHGLYVVTTALHKRGFEPETNTSFVAPGDREALVSAILEASVRPRRPVAATSGGAWDEIAGLHLAAYQRALGRR